MGDIKRLLDNNRNWSSQIKSQDPEFFSELAKQQNPMYLWIGCSDSRVAANTIVGLLPGEIFVHRNIANLVVHTDMNCLSVLQFAVDVLEVKHIIVTGHYGCGGVLAALDDKRHGLIDNWLRHIQDTASIHSDRLSPLESEQERFDTLCELNVLEQVINTCETTIVQDAWDRGQELTIHGLIYGLSDGILRDLEIETVRKTDRDKIRQKYFLRGATQNAA